FFGEFLEFFGGQSLRRVGRNDMAELDDNRRLRRRWSDKGKRRDRCRQQDFPHSVLPIFLLGIRAPRFIFGSINTGDWHAIPLPLSRALFAGDAAMQYATFCPLRTAALKCKT